MNTKHLELIYQYMGWCSHSNGDIIWEVSGCRCALCGNLMLPKLLDSNARWECVQEISKKGEWWGFHDYAIKNMPEGITYQHEETRWFMEADNFFNCMGSWLSDFRETKQLEKPYNDKR